MRTTTAVIPFLLAGAAATAGAQPVPSPQPPPPPTPTDPVTGTDPEVDPETTPTTDPAPTGGEWTVEQGGAGSGSGGGPTAPTPPPVEDEVGVEPEIFTSRLYGYIDARFEKSTPQPNYGDNGQTVDEPQAAEFDIPNFHVMLQGRLYGKYRYYFNLAAPGSGSPIEEQSLGLRNAWVELPIYLDYFNLRIGRTYRRFGLYNEILDAVPTFIGIEPPEMFDKDHLMLTRATNAMLHGSMVSENATLSYALTTGNDERAGDEVPFGADLRFEFGGKGVVGASYYTSNGDAAPTTDVGGGVPQGGVAQWMDHDQFQVYSLFGQLKTAGITLQAEYTGAKHQAVRDPERVLALEGAGLSARQLDYFGLDGDPTTTDDMVRTTANYSVQAAYMRLGYEFPAAGWEWTPYGQFDYYKNPELIAEKDFGGDGEAGLADGGRKYKSTVGLVAAPTKFVAIKADVSAHTQPFNGDSFTYVEGRLSFSIYWELGDAQ